MTVTSAFFDTFIKNVGNTLINLGSDTFKIILVDSYSYDSTHDKLADIGSVELSTGNGYTAGGMALTTVSWAFSGGYTKFDADDLNWEASGGSIGPATGLIIFDDTSTDKKLVCYVDFGQSESAGDGTDFKITFNANGIFRIS